MALRTRQTSNSHDVGPRLRIESLEARNVLSASPALCPVTPVENAGDTATTVAVSNIRATISQDAAGGWTCETVSENVDAGTVNCVDAVGTATVEMPTSPPDEAAATGEPLSLKGTITVDEQSQEKVDINTLDATAGSPLVAYDSLNPSTSGDNTPPTDESAKDVPADASEPEVVPPIIYTLGGDAAGSNIDLASSDNPAPLKKKDVKHIAKEIKRGHEVNLDVSALLQLHSTAKKDTRKQIERVIATTYAQCHASDCVVLPPSNVQQAIDAAFATLGAPTKTLKVNGRRYVAPPAG
jgi:hypothetical protein